MTPAEARFLKGLAAHLDSAAGELDEDSSLRRAARWCVEEIDAATDPDYGATVLSRFISLTRGERGRELYPGFESAVLAVFEAAGQDVPPGPERSEDREMAALWSIAVQLRLEARRLAGSDMGSDARRAADGIWAAEETEPAMEALTRFTERWMGHAQGEGWGDDER